MLIPLGFNRLICLVILKMPTSRGTICLFFAFLSICGCVCLPARRAGAAAGGDAVVFGQSAAGAARQPGRSDLQVRGRERRAEDCRKLSRVRALPGHRQGAVCGPTITICRCRRRSGSRGRRSNTRRRCSFPIVPHEGPTTVLMGLYSNASDSRLAARRHEPRPARLRRRAARGAEADRRHFRDVQGRLAPGGNAARQRGGRVAVDKEGSDAVGQKSEEGRDVLSASRSARPLSRAAAGHRHARRTHD